MGPTAEKVLEVLRSENPPQSIEELASAVGANRPRTLVILAQLQRAGTLTRDEVPWRRGKPVPKGNTPKGVASAFADLSRETKDIIKSTNKPLVKLAALKFLSELRRMGGEVAGPPPPDDRPGQLAALVRMLQAAGRELTNEAMEKAFAAPEATTSDPNTS